MTTNWFKAMAFGLVAVSASVVYGGEMRTFASSVKALGPDDSVMAVRSVTAADLEETLGFTISLSLRNLDELQARISAGENAVNGKLTDAEMQARYLPSAADYQKVVDWLKASGFTIRQTDAAHTIVAADGPVSLVARVMAVDFAKVTTADGDFTSAMSAPSLPGDLPAAVMGVDGLQPHLRAHHRAHRARPATITAPSFSDPTKNVIYIGPQDLRSAYGATSAMTGAGQTIAIINDTYGVTGDLATLWAAAGSTQTTANVVNVPVGTGPSANVDQGDVEESNLDISYAGGMAPGAQIRVYGMRSLAFSNTASALALVRSDHATNSSICVASMSFGSQEDSLSLNSINATSQQLLQLSQAGVAAVTASGDAGSRPDITLNLFGYQPEDPISAGYPASDPNCTGVGGTTLTFNGASGTTLTYGSETTWSDIPASPKASQDTYGASGGAISTFFTKPSYQSDGNAFLSAQTMRCTPDVAAMSDALVGANQADYVLIYINGKSEGVEGTSLACPLWAAVVAIVNQAKASASQSPIGALNPALYPLFAKGVFHDITTGNNGDYSATVGYDLTTGLGTPNLPTLVSVISGTAPAITSSPSSVTVQEQTSTSFTVAASGSPAPSYQWQRQPNGTSSFATMSEISGTYTGTTSATLTIVSPTTGMSGDQFRCVATNVLGTATSNTATLTVTAKPAPVSSGGGGGGGSVSGLFLGALAVLALVRFSSRHRLAA